MRRITSRQNPLVARYRAAAHGDAAALLLDGVHLVSDALAADLHLREAAVAADAGTDREVASLVSRLLDAKVDVVTGTSAVMAALSPVRSSSPIVALADRPVAPMAGLFSESAPLIVLAVDVQDPGNLGAIVRVAEAGGASGIIVAGTSADPFGWKALRGSMGSALRLPIVVETAPAALAEMRRRGCRIFATAPRDGRSIFDADFRNAAALVIGGEGSGLDPAILASADERVTIPMQAPVESLNAAVAAAVFVYEAARQRSRERRAGPFGPA
ncbi:MAG: RNA methyltransferase [Acidobacteria bacterium]|nr:RNA methyltransferase [Acidobacteriota bacterium]